MNNKNTDLTSITENPLLFTSGRLMLYRNDNGNCTRIYVKDIVNGTATCKVEVSGHDFIEIELRTDYILNSGRFYYGHKRSGNSKRDKLKRLKKLVVNQTGLDKYIGDVCSLINCVDDRGDGTARNYYGVFGELKGFRIKVVDVDKVDNPELDDTLFNCYKQDMSKMYFRIYGLFDYMLMSDCSGIHEEKGKFVLLSNKTINNINCLSRRDSRSAIRKAVENTIINKLGIMIEQAVDKFYKEEE